VPHKAPGDLPGQLGAAGCQVVPFVVIFGDLFWIPSGTFGIKVVTPGAPRTALGQPVARWCHLWSFLVTFLSTFWHPWCQGGPPWRTHGAPRNNFGSTFVPPRCKAVPNDVESLDLLISWKCVFSHSKTLCFEGLGHPGCSKSTLFDTIWAPFGTPWRP